MPSMQIGSFALEFFFLISFLIVFLERGYPKLHRHWLYTGTIEIIFHACILLFV